ncbi:MAG: glycosyltransferase family 4 protein [Deltaproteobacteria bacterium]|nr:glycosyltransferase family 4 protein [Deltaproteobacteria bacterium]MBZ0219857.1 glycosyltransferase family 4 protein [Deltaproteobacteria bacterium]
MTADTVGGVWAYSLELASALSARGVKVFLATMGPAATKEQAEEAREVKGLDLFEGCFKLEWMEDPWESTSAAGEWLLGLEETIGPDIVHLNGYCHGALHWRSPRIIVAHSCVISWWEAVREGPVGPEWMRYGMEVEKGLGCAEAVIAPTGAMMECLKRIYEFSAPAFIIHNGRSKESFRPGVKEELIFTAGRLWDEAKNIEALQAASRSISWPVYAAGAYEHDSGNFSSDGTIKMLGRLSKPEIAEWMSRASIFALPARYEPFGLTVLEAALSECALVLGDIPSLRELWDGAAVFVEPGDAGRLALALEMLASDRVLRARLGILARERAMEYTPERMAGAYHALYSRLSGAAEREGNACVS